MAATTEKVNRSFVKGLITEASPLTFPENASIDEDNFVLNRDGSRSRRLGIEYEEFYQLNDTGYTATQIKEGKQSFHRWDSPGGDTTVSIGVVRIIDRLWFVDLLSDTPSANLLNGGNYVSLAGLNGGDIETAVISNQLVVVGEDLDKPQLLKYAPATDTVTASDIDIEIRDLLGIDDGLDVGTRPGSLTQEHKYNLRNQGWSTSIVTTNGTDAIDRTFAVLGSYPSNSDVWTLGKISNPSSGDYEKYDPNVLARNSTSNYQAARGAYIIDAFNRGNSRLQSGATGLPTDQEQGRLTTVTSYAQRLFYSGVNSSVTDGDERSPNYSGYVFFTQVVTSNEKLGSCYQENDPTDPAINDIIPSDGGTIHIPECTNIVKIASAQASVLVFAENGIWEIFGDTGGFFATSYQVAKVSNNGVLNAKSVVDVNGSFLYWSKAGIYLLKTDGAAGRYRAESVSLTTIQTLYNNIPDVGKNFCKGYYNEKENRVRWLYNDAEDYSESNYINKYTKELVLDLTLQAWYPQSISDLDSNSPYIADYITIPGYAISTTEEDVLAGTESVLVTDGTGVVVDEAIEVNRASIFNFLTISGTSFTISSYRNRDFVDWAIAGGGTGADYSSYLITGYELFNDVMRRKFTPFIFFYFTRTENGYELDDNSNIALSNPSSCKVQAQWNWADSANSGKWGTEFQAYRLTRNYIPSGVEDPFDYGEGVIVTRNKLRGSGKVLSLKITSESGKDMQLLGWAHPAIITQRP